MLLLVIDSRRDAAEVARYTIFKVGVKVGLKVTEMDCMWCAPWATGGDPSHRSTHRGGVKRFSTHTPTSETVTDNLPSECLVY